MKKQLVLICDDEFLTSSLIDILVQEMPFELLKKSTNEAVPAVIDQINPDLVITSVEGLGSKDAQKISILRTSGYKKPIIVLNDTEDLETHHEIADAGANVVVSRPCSPATLLKHVQSLLTKS